MVILVPALPMITPSTIESVTVSVLLSTSANGVPEKTKLPATSSVTVKLAGMELALIVGLSLTGVMVIAAESVLVLNPVTTVRRLLVGIRVALSPQAS